MSPLEKKRLAYQPQIPNALENIEYLQLEEVEARHGGEDIAIQFPHTLNQPLLKFVKSTEQNHQPLRVGLVFSGGQAAGGHNVIAGIYDALKKLNPESKLFGFLNGPSGIIDNQTIEITDELIDRYRNMGGFDMIGSGRTKIETPDQFEASCETMKKLELDGLVIIGGDDSNTNAALLAEHFLAKKIDTRVIGVPKTIDGDLKNSDIEVSFGFDTATKTFSEIIGNITRDALSAKKYYFFIKLMGRSASHIALECALQTHANLTFIGEEIAANNRTLSELTNEIADMITERAKKEKNFGVVLIPEGIVEFIPEFQVLIRELNRLELEGSKEEKIAEVANKLTKESLHCFQALPRLIQEQLLIDRDPHGNVQVSKIETERLFIEAVKDELNRRKEAGIYKDKFSAQPLFCGYEGRSCFPSNFDCNYCYSLGHVAALLINGGVTGYMSAVKNLAAPVNEWEIAGLPLAPMIHMEERKGKMKPVIEKAMVDLEGKPFAEFKAWRKRWKLEDLYRYPGPIQFDDDGVTITLALEQEREPEPEEERERENV